MAHKIRDFHPLAFFYAFGLMTTVGPLLGSDRGKGLAGADGPVRAFHLPVYYVASNREAGIEDGLLPRLSMLSP